jgi:WD40 repeat protein
MRWRLFVIILFICVWIPGSLKAQFSFNVIRHLKEINHKVVFASYSPDGKYIITAGSDSSIIIWNADRLTIYRTLTGLKARPNVAVFSPDNMFVLAGGKDNIISMWDIGKMPPLIIKTFEGHRGQIKSIDVSSDGKYLASGSADGTIRIWDLMSTNLVYELKEHNKDVNSVRFSPDGKILASGGADGAINLWNMGKGSIIISQPGHKGWIRDIVFSSDGKLLASCGDDKLINIWQVPGLKKTGTLEGHKDWVQTIDFSPDGKTLISGGRDKYIILWDVATQKILRQSGKQIQTINTIAISPVRTDFISSCFDTEELEIWAISGLDESQWNKPSASIPKSIESENIISENKQKVSQEQIPDRKPDKDVQVKKNSRIELFSPGTPVQGRIVHDKTSIALIGRVSDPDGILSFSINGALIKLADAGIFQYNTTLTKGENPINMIAINKKGLIDESKFVIDCINPDALTQGQEVPEILKSKNFALLIGVSDYQDPGIPDLENPVKDAERLYNVLLSKYTFEKTNTKLLKNPTYKELIGTFDSLVQMLTSEDNLLIFYAGHGKWDEKGKVGSWFPSDASKTITNNWFRNSLLRDYLGSFSSKHILLIADACFSGAIFKSRAAFSEPSQGIENLYKLPSRKAMTSGILQEVPDESAFLKYLVNRLSDNEDKFLSSEELFIRFKNTVMDNSNLPNVPQFGVIQNVGDEGGDFIFVKK